MGKAVGFCPELHSTPSPSIPLSPERKRGQAERGGSSCASVSSKGCCRLTQLRGTGRNTRESRRRGREKRTDGKTNPRARATHALRRASLDGRSGTNTGPFHERGSERAWEDRREETRRKFLIDRAGRNPQSACRPPTAEKPIEWTSPSFGMPCPGKN